MMNLLTYVVLPIYTVLLAAGYNWFTFNFSVIGYSLGRRDAFLFLGAFSGNLLWQDFKLHIRLPDAAPSPLLHAARPFLRSLSPLTFLSYSALSLPLIFRRSFP